jgi:glycosyltransferase involved in cell wall biosynthesis
MRIGVNLFPLRPQVAGGLEFYVRNLLPEMFDLGGSDHFYYLITAPWNDKEVDFGRGPYKKIFMDSSSSRSGVIDPPRAQLRRTRWDIYRRAKELNLDLWFCPMRDLDPKYIDIPSLVTVPDIQHEFYPQFFTPDELRHRKQTVNESCQLATCVITISEYSRKTLLERHGLDPGKVHSVYLAAGREYNLQGAREAWPSIAEHYGLKEGYLFYPANTWPHKNHEMLLMALQRLKERGLTPTLVLTGAQIASMERMREIAAQLGCEGQLFHLDYVDRRVFPGLYSGAACLVFPSLFEGFGMPLVEAMACGCPVACSNVCSIPEVVGEAAVLFDPRSPDSIADALEMLLRNEGLRQELVAKGLRQAALFSWEKAARETLAIFETVRQQVRRRVGGFVPPHEVVEGSIATGCDDSGTGAAAEGGRGGPRGGVATQELERLLEESEADCTARLGEIQELERLLEESEADRATRLVEMERLGKQLAESEADRSARLAEIERLGKQLAESEADRAARLAEIERLGKQLAESEAERAALLEAVCRLEDRLQVLQSVRNNTLVRGLIKLGLVREKGTSDDQKTEP